jgi:hemoglobin-like flavoprotein
MSHAMLKPVEKTAIKRSWDLVAPLGETVADLFYRRLFEIAPQYRKLFAQDIVPQKRKLLAMLAFVVKSIDWSEEAWKDAIPVEEDMFLVVLALGRRHIELYHVPDEAYDAVAQALVWTLDYGLGEAFTAEVRDAWTRVYGILAKTMKMGRCAVGAGSATALRASDG